MFYRFISFLLIPIYIMKYHFLSLLYSDITIIDIIIIDQLLYKNLKKFNLVNNTKTVRFFYDHVLTDKENEATKLIFTNHVNRKAAIIGMISKYHASQIRFFFDTLSCTGYDGTLIIFFCQIDNKTIEYILSFSFQFEIVMVPIKHRLNYFEKSSIINIYKNGTVQKSILTDSFKTLDFIPIEFVSGDFRFEVAYSLYMNNFFEAYDLLFLTDIIDVMFQLDFRKFNYTDGVYVNEEARIYIKHSHYWLDMYKDFSKFANKCELCVGTMILAGKKSFSFLADLHNQIKDHMKILEYTRPNFQGTLNYLVYNNTYNYPRGYIHFITTEHGIINSIGKINEHLVKFNRRNAYNRLKFYDVYYHDFDYILYNQDFQKIAIIHHTKYIPETQNLTYHGLLKICKNYYNKEFENIFNMHQKLDIIF